MRRALLLVAGASAVLALVFVLAGPRGGGSQPAVITPEIGAHLALSDSIIDPRPPAPVPLVEGWRFLPDPGDLGLGHGWGTGSGPRAGWEPVGLPHDFNTTLTAASDRGAVGWYELQFKAPAQPAGRSWSVHFESVRRHATVWLNGRPIGQSGDPYAPFSLPAAGLVPGAENTLIVRVDNRKGPRALPEDWWNWGGIMGPVALEPEGRLGIEDLGVMPRLGCGLRCGELQVVGSVVSHAPARLRAEALVRVTDPRGRLVAARRYRLGAVRGRASLVLRVPLKGPPALWSPAHPSLYTAQVELLADGRIEQVQALRVGMRTVEVRRGILYLDGRRLWMHGASIHEDIAGHGAALTDEDIAAIVSQLRAAGANVTRAHYLLSPRLLDALDAAGIMVWEQAPVDHADPALRSAAGRATALALLRSTLIGDRNHPSVIISSVGNELSPNPDGTSGTLRYLQQAIPLARALDPAAPVALDTYCYPGFPKQRIYSQLDVLGISSYFGWYQGLPGHSIASFGSLEPFLRRTHARYPRQALAVSEFGAEGVYEGRPTIKGSYDFQSSYLRRTLAVLARLPFMNGSIYWTLREFAVGPGWTGGATLAPGAHPDGIHHKGLITYNGMPKPAYAVAGALLRRVPRFAR